MSGVLPVFREYLADLALRTGSHLPLRLLIHEAIHQLVAFLPGQCHRIVTGGGVVGDSPGHVGGIGLVADGHGDLLDRRVRHHLRLPGY